ncbi:MAG: hypothetical protein FVQ78_01315 [Solirubrobacterales bacterium]|nr:hypothetical protein [Solirubrobacterales bacterium]
MLDLAWLHRFRPATGYASAVKAGHTDVIDHGFKEGDPVWVEDGDGKHHSGIFVGDNESTGWFGGGPSAYVAHPEAHQAEVVSVFRITPRDE